jgi:cytochrome bd-type quinol oxidase subunit 2
LDSQIALETLRARARRSARAWAVSSLGPLTMLAGVVWAVWQPYRLTFLHPRGEEFWWLVIEPPLLVIAAGIVFALLVAPGLVEDIEAVEREGDV